ncbi:uncharacterized protein LOC105764092 isoform X2 [Gossypium raimondii]|uniref:uncharacterized protein LOC105764092 isoform X2 n=1 Tax=Gossypium raimondii TaxID=29730 RepID=UPI00063ABCF3|nr:uncharacterized protein LOC105764092 isoform X2 [Gossypium raimondii]
MHRSRYDASLEQVRRLTWIWRVGATRVRTHHARGGGLALLQWWRLNAARVMNESIGKVIKKFRRKEDEPPDEEGRLFRWILMSLKRFPLETWY